jgi:hypothetical protein
VPGENAADYLSDISSTYRARLLSALPSWIVAVIVILGDFTGFWTTVPHLFKAQEYVTPTGEHVQQYALINPGPATKDRVEVVFEFEGNAEPTNVEFRTSPGIGRQSAQDQKNRIHYCPQVAGDVGRLAPGRMLYLTVIALPGAGTLPANCGKLLTDGNSVDATIGSAQEFMAWHVVHQYILAPVLAAVGLFLFFRKPKPDKALLAYLRTLVEESTQEAGSRTFASTTVKEALQIIEKLNKKK